MILSYRNFIVVVVLILGVCLLVYDIGVIGRLDREIDNVTCICPSNFTLFTKLSTYQEPIAKPTCPPTNSTCPPPAPLPTCPPTPTLPPPPPTPTCPPPANTGSPASCPTSAPCPACPKIETSREMTVLPCRDQIRNAMNNKGGQVPRGIKDFLDIFLEYGATYGARDKFYRDIAQRGMYFKNAAELKARLDKHQKCWASDATKGTIKVGGVEIDDLVLVNKTETIGNVTVEVPTWISKGKLWVNQTERPLRMGVCTTSFATAGYIQEWISHYLMLGFSKVVIMDNTISGPEYDLFMEAVKPFMDLNLTEVHPEPVFHTYNMFDACRRNLTSQGYDWIAQIDTDEFLMINDPELPYCMGEFLKRFEPQNAVDKNIGGISVRWRMISTVGVVKNDRNHLIMEESLFQGHDAPAHVKTLYRTSAVQIIQQEHHPNYKNGFHSVDINFGRQEGPFYHPKEPEDWSRIEIRHFFGRSIENMVYDKMCATNSFATVSHILDSRMDKLVAWYKEPSDLVKLDTPTRYSTPLRQFIFGP